MPSGRSTPHRANADGFAARSTEIDDIARMLAPEPGQCGVVASLPGGGWCLDAVSRPAFSARLYRKLVAGYVYDVLDQPGAPAPAEHALDALRQCWLTRRPSVALGEDLRLEGRGRDRQRPGVDGELVQLSGYGEPACR